MLPSSDGHRYLQEQHTGSSAGLFAMAYLTLSESLPPTYFVSIKLYPSTDQIYIAHHLGEIATFPFPKSPQRTVCAIQVTRLDYFFLGCCLFVLLQLSLFCFPHITVPPPRTMTPSHPNHPILLKCWPSSELVPTGQSNCQERHCYFM